MKYFQIVMYYKYSCTLHTINKDARFSLFDHGTACEATVQNVQYMQTFKFFPS